MKTLTAPSSMSIPGAFTTRSPGTRAARSRVRFLFAVLLSAASACLSLQAVEPYAKVVTGANLREFEDEVYLQQAEADADGSVYVSGSSRGAVQFAPGIGFPAKNPADLRNEPGDVFIAKLDKNGGWLWAKRVIVPMTQSVGILNGALLTTPRADQETDKILVNDIKVGETNVFITGEFEPSDGSKLTGFVSKLDKAGNVIWTRYYVGGEYASVGAVAEGPDGEVYVGGKFRGFGAVIWAPAGGSFFSPATTDDSAFIQRLNAGGIPQWRVLTTSAAGGNEEVKALAIDGNRDVHVLMNFSGRVLTSISTTNMAATTPAPTTFFQVNLSGDWTTVPYVGKISSGGTWKYGRVFTSRGDLAAVEANSAAIGRPVTSAVTGLDLKLLAGKVFVAGSSVTAVGGTSPSTTRRGFLTRLLLENQAADGAVAYFRSGGDPSLNAYPARIRGAGSKLFVAGQMPPTLQVFGGVSPSSGNLGTLDKELISLRSVDFVGGFDLGLNPLWLRTVSRPADITPPAFKGPLLAYDVTAQRVFWGGGFRTGTGQALWLGDAPNELGLTTTKARSWGWLTALDFEGNAVQQARLTVESAFPPLFINDNPINTNLFSQTYLEGTEISISAQDQVQGGTRRLITGYTVDSQAGLTPANNLKLLLFTDTRVIFNWTTEHQLVIASDHATVGLAGVASAGDPNPLVGTNWVEQGAFVEATVGAQVEPLGLNGFGTRYLLSGYSVTGPINTNVTITNAVSPRIQVSQFQMTGPARINYQWKKQYRVSVTTSETQAESSLITRQTSPATGARGNGAGDFWFDDRSTIELLARATNVPGTLTLVGWDYASPVPEFFPFPTFKAFDPLIDDTQELSASNALSLVTFEGAGYWRRTIASLTNDISIAWNYGELVITTNITVGAALTPPAITGRGTPATDGWKRIRVLDAPPGSQANDMLIWDAALKIAYVTRPGVFLVDWEYRSGSSTSVVVFQVYSGFAGDPWQNNAAQTYRSGTPFQQHIVETPPVVLDPFTRDKSFFKEMRYTSGGAVVADGKFSTPAPGKSVLVFLTLPEATGANDPAKGDTTRERVDIRIVNSVSWRQALTTNSSPAVIGRRLTSALDTAGRRSGFVINENANYNAELYDRANAQGPIIPVNGRISTPDPASDRELIVVWYEQRGSVDWPYRPVWYNSFAWPGAPTDTPAGEFDLKQMVIASRLGSEGLDARNNRQIIFDSERYSGVKIYNQPDPAKPGYNPNEEHARIYPSLYAQLSGKSVPAAFALRNDLNITLGLINASAGRLTAADYTSDPYVLVQYFDIQAQEDKMAVYQVTRESALTSDPWLAQLPGSVGNTYQFRYAMRAGEAITAPYPLNLVIGLEPCINTVSPLFNPAANLPNGTYFEDRVAAQRTWFIDHKGGAWAVSGDASFNARFFYQLQQDFWYPVAKAFSGRPVGDCLTFLPDINIGAGNLGVYDPDSGRVRTEPLAVVYETRWPENVPVLKAGETLTYAGGEYKQDNPDAPGLPGIVGFAAGEVVFDSRNPAMRTAAVDPINPFNSFLARVIAPLEERLVALPPGSLPQKLKDPASPNIRVDGDTWYFNNLPPSLQKRVFYRPAAKLTSSGPAGVLGLRGYLNDRTLGDADLTAAPPPVYVLEPNVLTSNDLEALRLAGDREAEWENAIVALFQLSRNPNGLDSGGGNGWNVGLERVGGVSSAAKPLTALGPGLALVANPRLLNPANATPGYITLAENNDESLGEAPVTLHVIRVDPAQRYRGAIKTILPANVFDEKITLRHTADFGGNIDNEVAFAWWYREEDGTTRPGDVPPGVAGTTPVWSAFGNAAGVAGLGSIELTGNPTLLLADNLFFSRYRVPSPTFTESSWSGWAGAANSSIRDLDGDGRPDYRAQLATGWVKRVLDAVNPYEARVREFGKNNSPATAAGIIQQLGAPFVGPVALNASKDVVENLGLIELYETVLKRARDLSIDAAQPTSTPGINAAILLASTRLADFYSWLGDEAWDDALDPTIGFGNNSIDPGSLNSSRFCFQNQLPTLLGEELALLRGRDESLGRPVFNRLFWNFTKGEGEVAYALNYQITDVNNDGFIDENDALRLHPMGHGDAWGHYLSAMRKRYDLLRSSFDWEARGEFYNLLDVVLRVDFDDERSFARTAAARARVGNEIVNLTFRSRYSEGPDSKLSGYTDPNQNRGWGVTEWARRTSHAALFDWITANAILPLRDPDTTQEPQERLDRLAVTEVGEIAANLSAIQVTLDAANSGLNAIGLNPDVLAFDLDPTFIDVGSTAQVGTRPVQGLSHYEQIYERAQEALRNANTAFLSANEQKARLRQVALSAEQLRKQAVAQDLEYRNRMIEIFGTPYSGQIGAGKAYPAGYNGPDLNLFMYVDVNAVTADTVPVANTNTYFDEYVSFYELAQDIPEEFRADIEEHFLDDISLEGNTAVDLLGDDLVHLRLPATAADYTFVAPESWGQRSAPGRLQTMVGEMLQVQAELGIAVGDYDFLIKQLRDRVALMKMRADINVETLGIKDERYGTVIGLNTAINALRLTSESTSLGADLAVDLASVIADGLPKIVGLANDAFGPVRALLRVPPTLNRFALKITSLATGQAADILDSSKEIIDLRDEIAIDEKEMSVELRGMLYEIEELLVNEGVTRVRLFALREQLRGLLDQYRATLQEGLRLIEERRNANVQLAAATQDNRYHDVLFRGARHESIQRYRTLFDLAQRYCYLTAKAYDYETNFDPRDRASAQPLLAEIVRARSLGRLQDGVPAQGGGLAGIMARLQDNFRAVEGRLGFNNFQFDTTEFSIRNELARVESDEQWVSYLEGAKRADLWQVPAFRLYCRPFGSPGAVEPGLVLGFSSAIIAGKNFFGQPLGPGDSAYDPTLYATKIRAAGIKFNGYPLDQLARTPYVYLVPAGLDTMTVPNSPSRQRRDWRVVDQAIPVPHTLGNTDLTRPEWLAGVDSLSGLLGENRRFSSFRAAVDLGDPSVNATRLVGRSVWNSGWLLIIPGQSLHQFAETGISEFIEKVSDIKITFETYGYSGN